MPTVRITCYDGPINEVSITEDTMVEELLNVGSPEGTVMIYRHVQLAPNVRLLELSGDSFKHSD